MIKKFEDGSYLEVTELENGKDITVSLCSRDSSNPIIVTILSVKMSKKDFLEVADSLKEK